MGVRKLNPTVSRSSSHSELPMRAKSSHSIHNTRGTFYFNAWHGQVPRFPSSYPSVFYWFARLANNPSWKDWWRPHWFQETQLWMTVLSCRGRQHQGVSVWEQDSHVVPVCECVHVPRAGTTCLGLGFIYDLQTVLLFYSLQGSREDRTGLWAQDHFILGCLGATCLGGCLSSGSPVGGLGWLPLLLGWKMCTPSSSGGKQPVPVGLLWSQQAAFVSPNSEILQKATEWAGDCFLGREPWVWAQW